jgi:hypothetical protein
METLSTYRCPHQKRADDYCADCFMDGETLCVKCGQKLSDAVAVISGSPPPAGVKERRLATLTGWKCVHCGHVNPDPLSKLSI